MARLYAEINSDKRGRVAGKGGEEYITIMLKEKNIALFDVTFKANDKDGWLEILRYSDGTTTRFSYMNEDIPT